MKSLMVKTVLTAVALANLIIDSAIGNPPIATYDVSRDFSITSNPAGVWSYGWKNTFDGAFNVFTFYRRQNQSSTPPGGYIDVWARFSNDQSLVWRNGSTCTVYVAGSQGVYPPGTVLLSPGVNGRDDNYAAVRFTVPESGTYLLSSAVQNMFHGSYSGDTDYHVVINGVERFGQDIPRDSGTNYYSGGYTNNLTLAAGETVDLLVGRGLDGDFNGSGLMLAATIELLTIEPVAPAIVAQPIGQSVFNGANVCFSVTASGSPPLNYQWKLEGADIAGATNSSLVLNNVQSNQAGNYTVAVANTHGTVLSSNATLTVVNALAVYDISSDFSATLNPAGVWSYGWKTDFSGAFNLFGFHLRQYPSSFPPGGFIDVWARFANDQSIVWHNGSTSTVYAADMQGVYPPGTVLMSPGINERDDNFAGVRFTAPESGTYLLSSAVQNMFHGSYSGDTDYHVVINGVERFGQHIPRDTSSVYQRGGYTNTLTLAAGDTVDLLVGRGLDGNFNGSGLMVAARIAMLTAEPVPPSIVAQPLDQTVFAGGRASFRVLASGSPPLSYQWQQDGVDIPGATSSSLVLSNVQPSQIGNYSVMVTNAYGAVCSSNASLSVINTLAVYNISSDFCVTANPAGVWSYGWKSDLSGAFNLFTCYRRVFASSSPPGGFIDVWARFVNDQSMVWHNGSASTVYAAGSQGVYPPGTILLSPGVNERDDNFAAVRFTAPESGTYLLSSAVKNMFHGSSSGDTDYHVVVNGAERFGQQIPRDTATEYHGGGYTNELTLAAGDTVDLLVGRGLDGNFNGSGLVIAATVAMLTSEPVPPSIVAQPSDRAVFTGANVSFNVTASGSRPLSYQWQKDGTDIPGATSSCLVLSNVQPNQAGNYAVVVTNMHGTVVSSNALLTIVNALAVYNVSADFSVTSNPAGVWSYGWKSDFMGAFNLFSFYRRQVASSTPPGGFVDSWSRFVNDQSVVWHNGSASTIYTAGSQGIYPPGTVLMSPGINSRDDNYAAVRFTAPANGSYLISSAVQNMFHGSISGDTDYHVVINGVELFGQFIAADNASVYHGGGYTNTITLAAGDTVDFLVGRGMDGNFSGSGLTLEAVIAMLTAQPVPPAILGQPMSQTAAVGENVSFNVTAHGAPPLTYQWKYNGNDIDGAINATLALEDIQASQAGEYSVVVANANGSVLSSNATLTVLNRLAGYDLSADFSTNLNPARLWSYGWKSNFDGTFNPFTFSGRQFVSSSPPGGFIDYWSRFANDQSLVWRNSSSSTVYAAGGQGVYPPGTVLISAGVNGREDNFAVARFTAPASGTYLFSSAVRNMFHGSLSGDTDFHVVVNGVELFGDFLPGDTDSTWHTSGYTNTLTLGTGDTLEILVGRGRDGNFNGSGLTIQATVNLLSADPVPPMILAQPRDQAVIAGANVSFSIVAGGAPPLSYQWKFDGTDIEGAINSTLTLNQVQMTQAGNYSVLVTNLYGTVLSSNAALVVLEGPPMTNTAAPVIVTPPLGQTVPVGTNVTFNVVATGDLPLYYQWLLNGIGIPGATNSSLLLEDVQTTQAGNYSVRVLNAAGSVDSAVAVLTVVVINLVNPGTLLFNNRDWSGPVIAPISFAGEGPAAAGPINGTNAIASGEFTWGGINAMAGLYAGPAGSAEEQLVLLAPAVGFRAGGAAGYVDPGMYSVRTVPNVAAGEAATVQIRVWDVGVAGAASYEDASAIAQTRPVYLGKSALVNIPALGGFGMPPSLPASLVGLTAFDASYAQLDSEAVTNALLINPVQNSWLNAVKLVVRMPDAENEYVRLEFLGSMGQAYLIQSSTNLVEWTTIGNCSTILDGTIVFQDTTGLSPNRFYRILVP